MDPHYVVQAPNGKGCAACSICAICLADGPVPDFEAPGYTVSSVSFEAFNFPLFASIN